nr:hypothetical protein [Streptomyces sp. BK340]
MDIEGILEHLAGLRMTRRDPALAEIAATAVFSPPATRRASPAPSST